MNKLILATVLALAAAGAAQAAGQAWLQQPHCADPCVPRPVRDAAAAGASPAAAGAALQQQAVAKLRQRFNEADLDANGALTQDEARKAGLGWVVNHFAEIDTAHSGKITFDAMRAYMSQRRRQALGPAAPQ